MKPCLPTSGNTLWPWSVPTISSSHIASPRHALSHLFRSSKRTWRAISTRRCQWRVPGRGWLEWGAPMGIKMDQTLWAIGRGTARHGDQVSAYGQILPYNILVLPGLGSGSMIIRLIWWWSIRGAQITQPLWGDIDGYCMILYSKYIFRLPWYSEPTQPVW